MALRITKKRNNILRALRKHRGTLTARELHVKVPTIDLVTVYRSLDVFVRERIIKKIYLDSGEALYEYQKIPHHHAICRNCEKVIHFSASDEKIKKLLQIKNFTIDSIEVTVRGVCKK